MTPIKTVADLAEAVLVIVEVARCGGLDDGQIAYELLHADRTIYEEIWDMLEEVYEDLEPWEP